MKNLRTYVVGLFLTFVAFVPSANAQLSSIQTWAGTAGGSSNALTIAIHNVATANDLLGVPIRFIPATTNTASATLTINLDSGGTIGATTITRRTSNLGIQTLAGGEMFAAQITELTYDGTEFVITSALDLTPVGHSIDLRQSSGTAPSGYLIEDGSCYAQAAYPSLFGLIGTSYNALAPVGCSGSQFAVPDSRGTTFLARDGQGVNGSAGRITSASCATPNAIGLCGTQTKTLITANLPAYTPQGTIIVPGFSNGQAISAANGSITTTVGSGGINVYASSQQNLVTFAGNAQGGSSTAVSTLDPVLVGIRAIKY